MIAKTKELLEQAFMAGWTNAEIPYVFDNTKPAGAAAWMRFTIPGQEEIFRSIGSSRVLSRDAGAFCLQIFVRKNNSAWDNAKIADACIALFRGKEFVEKEQGKVKYRVVIDSTQHIHAPDTGDYYQTNLWVRFRAEEFWVRP
jgi:hypothetical protein